MFDSLLERTLPTFRVLAIAFLLTVWIVPGIGVTDAALVSPQLPPDEVAYVVVTTEELVAAETATLGPALKNTWIHFAPLTHLNTVERWTQQNFVLFGDPLLAIAGRAVRTVLARELSPDDHEVIWDGLDNKGQALPSGTYVVKDQAGDESMNEKVTLLK